MDLVSVHPAPVQGRYHIYPGTFALRDENELGDLNLEELCDICTASEKNATTSAPMPALIRFIYIHRHIKPYARGEEAPPGSLFDWPERRWNVIELKHQLQMFHVHLIQIETLTRRMHIHVEMRRCAIEVYNSHFLSAGELVLMIQEVSIIKQLRDIYVKHVIDPEQFILLPVSVEARPNCKEFWGAGWNYLTRSERHAKLKESHKMLWSKQESVKSCPLDTSFISKIPLNSYMDATFVSSLTQVQMDSVTRDTTLNITEAVAAIKFISELQSTVNDTTRFLITEAIPQLQNVIADLQKIYADLWPGDGPEPT